MSCFKSILFSFVLIPIILFAQESHPTILDTPAEFTGWQGETIDPSTIDTIRIGFFAPDRLNDPLGTPMYNAATMAIEEANADGGYHNTPFALKQRWSNNPWGAGSKKVIQLVYEDSVWVVIGSLDGNFTHIAEQIVTKAWLPLISPVSSDPTLNYIRIPWMFRLPPGDEQQAEVIVRDGLQKQSLQRIGLITTTDHDGRIFQEEIRDNLHTAGLNPVFHFEVDTAKIDYEMLSKRARSFQTDAIILRLPGKKTLQLIDSLGKMGVNIPLFLPWIPGISGQELSERYGGTIYTVRPFRITDNQDYEQFNLKYVTRFGVSPTPAAAYTYDALRLFLHAINISGLNRIAIRQAIANSDGFEGVSGTIHWDNGWANQGNPFLDTLLPDSLDQ